MTETGAQDRPSGGLEGDAISRAAALAVGQRWLKAWELWLEVGVEGSSTARLLAAEAAVALGAARAAEVHLAGLPAGWEDVPLAQALRQRLARLPSDSTGPAAEENTRVVGRRLIAEKRWLEALRLWTELHASGQYLEESVLRLAKIYGQVGEPETARSLVAQGSAGRYAERLREVEAKLGPRGAEGADDAAASAHPLQLWIVQAPGRDPARQLRVRAALDWAGGTGDWTGFMRLLGTMRTDADDLFSACSAEEIGRLGAAIAGGALRGLRLADLDRLARSLMIRGAYDLVEMAYAANAGEHVEAPAA
jgi:thioredoxin-like negative regulator of GroEL